MKSLLVLALLAMSSTSQAFVACEGGFEAQFVAQVANVEYSHPEAGNIEHATFGLKNFRFFQPNPLCPLDDMIAANAVFWFQGPLNVEEGSEISGVLVWNPKLRIFSIK